MFAGELSLEFRSGEICPTGTESQMAYGMMYHQEGRFQCLSHMVGSLPQLCMFSVRSDTAYFIILHDLQSSWLVIQIIVSKHILVLSSCYATYKGYS